MAGHVNNFSMKMRMAGSKSSKISGFKWSAARCSHLCYSLKVFMFSMLFLYALPLCADDAVNNVKENSVLNLSPSLEEGDRLLVANKLDEAVKIFNAILIENPENAHAIYQLGVISVRKGQTKEGIALIKKAAMIAPDNVTYHMALASMYEFSSQIVKALDKYAYVLSVAENGSPDFIEARKKRDYLKATLKARQGNLQAAAKEFSTLAKQYPDDFLIRYSLGVAMMITDRMDAAELHLIAAKKLNPEYGNIYLSLASVYERKGDLSKAYETLYSLLETSSPEVLLQKARVKIAFIEGRLLQEEGNVSDALNVYDAALSIEPDNLKLLGMLAGIYEQINDSTSEINIRLKIIKLMPSAFAERLRLVNLYSNAKNLEKALEQLNYIITHAEGTEFYQKANGLLDVLMVENPKSEFARTRLQKKMDDLVAVILNEPDNLDVWQRLAVMYYLDERLEKAQDAFAEVLRLDPENSRALLSLGSILDRLGLYEESVEYFARAISLETNDVVVSALIVELSLIVGKMNYLQSNDDLALDFFSYVIEKSPSKYQARFFSGLIYLRQNRLPEALDAFQRIVQNIPGHMGARLNLAQTYENMNEEEKAIEEYQDILRLEPPSDIAEQARQKIEFAEKRIRGFSKSVAYQMSYDNNSNLSSSEPDSELRTDLSLNVGYRYKAENGIRWYFSTAPVYSSYHTGQFDFLNTSTTVSATIFDKGLNFNAGLTNSNSRGLLNSERASDSYRAFAEISSRVRLPVLTDWTFSNRVLSNFSVNMAYSEIDSLQSPFFSAFNYSAGVRMNQPVGERMAMGLGYNYILNQNMEVVGSDYAYRSHSINVSFERGLLPRVAMNVAYSLNFQNFLNPDAATNFTSTRTNLQQSISIGSSYQMEKYFLLFASFSWSNNSSNLPIKFTIDAQDVIEGQLSPSLGDYSRGVFTTGLSMRL